MSRSLIAALRAGGDAPGISPHAKSVQGNFRAVSDEIQTPSTTVYLAGGHLVVNGHRISHPRFTRNGISWSQKTASHFSSGSLHVMANGGILSGMIATGRDESHAAPVAVNMVTDDLKFTTEVCKDMKATPQVWEPGPPLTVGVNFPGGGGLPYVTAQIGGQDVDNASPLPPQGDGDDLHLTIGIEEFECGEFDGQGYPVPMASDITMGFDGNSFTGQMTACGAPSDSVYGWRGKIVPAPKPLALAHAAEPLVEQPLSIPDLMSQTTDGAVDVAKAKFQNFILYAMDDWRDKLFGSAKPDLSPAEQQVVADNLGLYTDHACDAFILQQLSVLTTAQGGPSDPISATDKDHLQWFWQQGLTSLTPGYNDVSNRLTQISWIQVDPRIQDYVTDPSNNWAQKLFDQLTTPEFLDRTVIAYIASGFQLTQVNRYAELLLALSPKLTETIGSPDNLVSCTLATKYHSKFMGWFGARLNSKVTYDSPESTASFAAFLPGWIAGARAKIALAMNDPAHPLSAGQQTMYAEAEATFAAAEREQGGMAALCNEIASGIAAQAGSNLFAKIANWTKLNPMGKKLAAGAMRAINVAAFCYSLQSVIGAFKNWSNLNDAQKAQTVVSTGELAVELMNMVADAGLPETLAKLFTRTREWDGLGEAVEAGLFEDLQAGRDFFSATMEWLGPELGAPEKSGFTRMFETGSRFMKGFAVAAAAAAVGFSAYQVYEDFSGRTGIAQEVLDTLMLTANVVMLAGEIAALTVGECLMATLGPVGAVFGVVLAIVVAFLPTPPPDRPSDDYMKDRGTNFLATLNPPADWKKTPQAAVLAVTA